MNAIVESNANYYEPWKIWRQVIRVEVRSFNNRHLNRDLVAVSQRENELQPRLPDGRLLILYAPSKHDQLHFNQLTTGKTKQSALHILV